MLYKSYKSINNLPSIFEKQAAVRRRINIQLFLIFGLIITALVLTNPSESEHRKAVVNYLELAKNYNDKLYHYADVYKNQRKADLLWTIFTTNHIDLTGINLNDIKVSRENYYLFSNTKVLVHNKWYFIRGFGLAGRVYFFSIYSFEDVLKFEKIPVYQYALFFLFIVFILVYFCIVTAWRRPNIVFWIIIVLLVYGLFFSGYIPSFN